MLADCADGPTVEKTLSTSGTAISRASTWRVASFVTPSGVPDGMSIETAT